MADSWKLPSPISNSDGSDHSRSCENPFDWSCEGLKGRATGIFLPLEKDEILVKDGDVVSIQEQTLDGNYFVIFNQRSGESGRVPVEYIEIIPEDVDQIPLPVKPQVDPTPTKPGLHRKLGVSRKRGREVRQRMSAHLSTINHIDNGEDQDQAPPQASTFPRLTQRVTATSPSIAQSSATASATAPLPDNIKDRSSTSLPPDGGEGEADRRGTRSATVTTAVATPTEEVTEYEPAFRFVEQYNIFTWSGSDRDGRPVIIFSACRLPASYAINHDVLLRYMKYTLDQVVEQDYTVLYCHYGLTSHNKPRFAMLRQMYKEMDRKYKKNIKKVYILHPTNFIRVMMSLMRPFINYKFGRKLSYINRLAELEPVLYLDQMDIPDEVKAYDKTLRTPVRNFATTDSRSVFHTPLPEDGETGDLAAGVVASKKQFGVALENVAMDKDNIPRVLKTCVSLLEKKGMEVVGLFRRTPATVTIQMWKKRFNEDHDVDLETDGDPHLAAVLIKLFLRELPEPLLTFDLYKPIMELSTIPAEKKVSFVKEKVQQLPLINVAVLHYLISFLSRVAEKQEVNKMTPNNLAIVLGPNLVWSSNEVASLVALTAINAFTLILITHCSEIFPETQNQTEPE